MPLMEEGSAKRHQTATKMSADLFRMLKRKKPNPKIWLSACYYLSFLVHPERFERPTPWFVGR